MFFFGFVYEFLIVYPNSSNLGWLSSKGGMDWGRLLCRKGEILRTTERHPCIINEPLSNMSMRPETSAPISTMTPSMLQQGNVARILVYEFLIVYPNSSNLGWLSSKVGMDWGWLLCRKGEILRTSERHPCIINEPLSNMSMRLETSTPISTMTPSMLQQGNAARILEVTVIDLI